MPRKRDYPAELARRNQAARRRGYSSYYQERLARARKARPGISTTAARGHARAGEREALRLLKAVRRLPPDAQIAFTGLDRQRDGTWRQARFDIIAPGGYDATFIIDEPGLYLLPQIADSIAATGITVLGAQYLSQMVDTLEQQQLYAIRGRTGRFVFGLDKTGRARTVTELHEAALFNSEVGARRYLGRHRLAARGYRVFAL